jgi:orotidine-5'-phosphate decarboxylase
MACPISCAKTAASSRGPSIESRESEKSTTRLCILEEVLRLADLAAAAGAQGVVCSGNEARAVKQQFGDRLAVLVPGVRPAGSATHDQARVVTPSHAAEAGADYVVVGRAITGADRPAESAAAIAAELA